MRLKDGWMPCVIRRDTGSDITDCFFVYLHDPLLRITFVRLCWSHCSFDALARRTISHIGIGLARVVFSDPDDEVLAFAIYGLRTSRKGSATRSLFVAFHARRLE